VRRLLVKDLLWGLDPESCITAQGKSECLEWVNSHVAYMAEDFVREHKLTESHFIKGMNNAFRTNRFEPLLKRWTLEYLRKLFNVLNNFVVSKSNKELYIMDTPLNRFAVEKYYSRFGILPAIKWNKESKLFWKIFSILLRCPAVLYLSLNKGVKVSAERKKYKVMREAVWGLYDVGGHYFHDDFMIDGHKLKREDLLLYSRGIPVEAGRLKGYHDAKKSPYGHFDLQSLSLGIGPLFSRVIPKYIIQGCRALFKEASSRHFLLYWSIYSHVIYNALPYEKVFSHFEVISELGHNYFCAGHIIEAIVCQNYGTKYYAVHWSQHTTPLNKYLLFFLGCDRFLTWGRAHIKDIKEDSGIFFPTGYPFKRFIKEVRANKDKILNELAIKANGKIISFFDESFGIYRDMTEGIFVRFWEIVLRFAERESTNTILIKPKDPDIYDRLSDNIKKKFFDIKTKLEEMPNVYIVNSNRWSFIEVIGVSDIVVTQGIGSSATIGIICGIEGLYLDEAREDHPFRRSYKDSLVFDEPEKLLTMVQRILRGTEAPLKVIPEDILRAFDEYPDDRGIDLLRDIVSGENV